MTMFESGVSIQRSQVLNFAAMQAQSVLQTAAVVLSKNIPEEKRAAPPGQPQPFTPEKLLKSGIGIYLHGLDLITPN